MMQKIQEAKCYPRRGGPKVRKPLSTKLTGTPSAPQLRPVTTSLYRASTGLTNGQSTHILSQHTTGHCQHKPSICHFRPLQTSQRPNKLPQAINTTLGLTTSSQNQHRHTANQKFLRLRCNTLPVNKAPLHYRQKANQKFLQLRCYTLPVNKAPPEPLHAALSSYL